jgi:hypothetical protein
MPTAHIQGARRAVDCLTWTPRMNSINGKVALGPERESSTPHPCPLPSRGEGEEKRASRPQPRLLHMRGEGEPGPEPGLFRVLWDAWKTYSHRASGYQTNLLLSAVYLLVLGPSAIVARLFGSKLLDLDSRPRSSYWIERKPAENTLAALERQF